MFYVTAGRREPIVGVVGALQFEVITSRLRSEYGVAVEIEPAEYSVARWLASATGPKPSLGGQGVVAVDRQNRRVLLFASAWELQYFERQHPEILLLAESPVATPSTTGINGTNCLCVGGIFRAR